MLSSVNEPHVSYCATTQTQGDPLLLAWDHELTGLLKNGGFEIEPANISIPVLSHFDHSHQLSKDFRGQRSYFHWNDRLWNPELAEGGLAVQSGHKR